MPSLRGDAVRVRGAPVTGTDGPGTREVVQLGLDELDAVLRRRAVAFGDDPTDPRAHDSYGRALRDGDVWGLVDGGEVVAHCRRRLVHHWFGGRRVPAQHIASVAVPPEHRGRGVATELMAGLAARDAAGGAGMSLLFPATTRLYRKLGWEHAGWLQTYRLDARRATVRGPAMRPSDSADDWDAIQACYERWARSAPAAMDRADADWDAYGAARYRYVLDGDDGTVTAYALVDHERPPGDWQYALRIRDWAATSADGLRALVAYVGSHGSIGKAATFRGPVPNPWVLLLPEQDLERVGGMLWMARPLDLATAVTARGYPDNVRADVVVAVDDPLLPANRGPWRLCVEGGEAELLPTAGADPLVHADVRALGPLLTGFLDPSTLRTAGLLRGDDTAVAALAGPFASGPPTLMDFF